MADSVRTHWYKIGNIQGYRDHSNDSSLSRTRQAIVRDCFIENLQISSTIRLVLNRLGVKWARREMNVEKPDAI